MITKDRYEISVHKWNFNLSRREDFPIIYRKSKTVGYPFIE